LLLTSPIFLLALLHARARRVIVRATLSVFLPLVHSAARALGVLPGADSDPNARVVEDPDLPVWLAGVSSLVGAERRAKTSLWEWWLDALRFSPDSPGRAHIRQLLLHPETARKLEALFEALATKEIRTLDKDALVRFSAGIRGTVRVLLDRDVSVSSRRDASSGFGSRGLSGQSIELDPPTERESRFLIDNFDLLFPPEHPLDFQAFLSMAKLVLVRRIVKALVKRHGLRTVRAGMRAPVVVDLFIIDEEGKCLFRVHTVAPSTAPGMDGHRLGAIVESPGVPERGNGTPSRRGRRGEKTEEKNASSSSRAAAAEDADPSPPLRMSDVWREARAIQEGKLGDGGDEETEEAAWSDYS